MDRRTGGCAQQVQNKVGTGKEKPISQQNNFDRVPDLIDFSFSKTKFDPEQHLLSLFRSGLKWNT